MSETRVPKILEAEMLERRKTKQQIAEDLGVSRMTVYRDTQTPLYEQLKEQFLTLYIDGVRDLATHDKESVRQRAIEEMGRSLRAGVVKQAHIRTESAEIKIHLHEFKKDETE